MSLHQAELAGVEIRPEQILRIALTGDGYFNYEVASDEARVEVTGQAFRRSVRGLLPA
jgi:hypothetical protein